MGRWNPIAFGLLCLVSGCADPAPPRPAPERGVKTVSAASVKPKASAPQPLVAPAANAEHDHGVLMAVLLDLLGDAGKDSPLEMFGGPPPKIAFSNAAVESAPSLEDVLRHVDEVDLGDAGHLSNEQLARAKEAAAMLGERCRARRPFAPIVSRDGRIRVRNQDSPIRSDDPFDHVRPVEAWPPGYTADGRLAVVRLVMPWSGWHVAMGTFVLEDLGGRWTVRLRRYTYYP